MATLIRASATYLPRDRRAMIADYAGGVWLAAVMVGLLHLPGLL
ncbi:hypothetical protein [Jannaschia sp. LMIT008]|nr:hypothetical protein [Jannaschia sp. LMIT008]